MDIGRAVARAHADGGLARGIRRLDHRAAARGQNQARVAVTEKLLHRVQSRQGQAANCPARAARGLCGFGGNLRGLARAVDRAGVRRKDDGAARFQGDEAFVKHGRGRIRGGNNAHDYAHRHADFPQICLFFEKSDGFHAANRLENAPRGEAVFLGLVGGVSEARLLGRHPAKRFGVLRARLADGGNDAVQFFLRKAAERFKCALRPLGKLPRLLARL